METKKEWMDEIVNAHERARALEKNERYNAFGMSMSKKDIQMDYEGIINLAHDTGMAILFNPCWHPDYPDTGEAYIMYREYKFFGLWEHQKRQEKTL